MIHFWVPADTATPADVLAWDPDLEPRRYASGVGHNLLELYARLARRGLEVSLGEEAPRGTQLVVVFSKSVFQPERLRSALRAGRRAAGRFAVIRSDAPASWRFPVRPLVEFMPTRGSVLRPWQQWLPPLLQRGLVPRLAERHGHIRSLAFKGSRGNFPPVLRTAGWEHELASRGIEWTLDAPDREDGSDQSWHDFSLVDAVLCVRNTRQSSVVERKPATRLLNAWAAGCVPLAAPDPGYVELGTDRSDVFFIESLPEALTHLDRLNADGGLLAQVERGIRAQSLVFSATSILDGWSESLSRAAAAEPTRWPRARSTRVIAARATLAAGTLLDPALTPVRRALARARQRAARRRRGLA